MLLSSHRAEQEDTPLTLRSPLSRGSFILSPGPPAVPAEPPLARLRQRAQRGRKIVFLGARPGGEGAHSRPAAAGRREGRVPRQSRWTPGPTGRRPSADCSAGFRERVPAPARPPGSGGPRERPPPFLPRVRGVPAAPPVSGTSQEAPPGFRPVSQRSKSPASSTADGQGAGADGPEPCGPKRSGAPRARPVGSPGRGPPPTHHPLSPPACARQQPLAPAPHLRRAPAPSSPPEPAVYTGSDVSGPTPPPAPGGRRVAADQAARS
ncbi:basic salivary proline-rich protein 1-like [Physeter macrocephalus]|uniref:Basic salivary proline-rich protein 1-like n=1 Tax=Physeter macrocephalus TaxID=9755 RepID=A0A2Y9TC85_PHYMC|nr:basic salivary proline-rich protein 1-like [Physeter catodon]|eukprot:XP_023988531.1 basic salivary proline-rich protein 1-like [Physeter catodon]